ncbi:MAG TPA: hypothetical protein DCP31_32385, partial [Cyanobacteria bacterium UBA8543]|nr:hypothetical protein [Cyanobacteria bacterium UBA8543]
MWRNLKQRIGKWREVLITAPSVAGLAIAASSMGLFQTLEWASHDLFFRLRPREPVDPRIVIVTIDESDLTQIGRWPISDAVLAKLLEKLNAQQPRAIGLDLYRDIPVEPGHQELVKVFKSTPNLIGVEKVVGNTVAPSPTLKQLGQVAMADLVLDADGKVRRGLLTIQSQKGQTRESLGVKLALMYLKNQGLSLQVINAAKKHYRLGKAVFMPFTGNEGAYVNADAGGYQIFLNFRGTQKNFHTVSITDVLENRIPPNLVRDRLVLIGSTAQSLNDHFFTPYITENFAPWSFTSPKRMAGVVIHANLTSQILSAALEGRPLIKSWPEPVEWLWILSWSFVGATVRWLWLKGNAWKTRWTAIGLWIVPAGGILFTSSYLAFLAGWWIPVVSPLFALAGSAIAIAGYHRLELQRDKTDLEILLEMTTQHHDAIEVELHNQAQEAVKASERKLAQFLDAVPVGVIVIDATGKPYFTNQKAQELLGKGVVSSATILELAEVYQYYVAGTDQIYPVENLAIVRALRGEHATVDDLEIHQGDKIIPIEAWGTPIYDESGNITYAIAAFKDITERKRAQDALRQAEEKYRSIFENALEGIFQTTPDGRYINANPALAQLYGYNSPQELMETLSEIEHHLYVNPNRRHTFVELME